MTFPRRRLLSRDSRKQKPILIHTSGTGLISSNPNGAFLNSREYNDTCEADIRDIDPSSWHRNVDLEVFKADSEGVISAYIICPPTIYGVGTGPGHRTSIQIPMVIRDALQRNRAAHIGPGESRWDNAHIEDLAKLYVLVLKRAVSADASKDTTPYSKFYFAAAARHNWGEVARKIGDILFTRNLVEAPGAISVTFENGSNIVYAASTSRSVPERAYRLGWKPTKASLKESLEGEVDAVLKDL